jgi:HKD family nuclease
MQVVVLGQPDRRKGSIGEDLRCALRWRDARQAWFAVAWARRSGLARIEKELRAFRKGNRSLRALIGIDQHGGTIEGLQKARELFTEARVYHDANRNPVRTFHPKLFVVQAPSRARAIVGSGNLTAAGLSTNYELSMRLDLDLEDHHDRDTLAALRTWFDARWSQKEATVRLTKSSIQALIQDPDVVVVPETWAAPRSRSRSGPSEAQAGLFAAVKGLAKPKVAATGALADRVDSLLADGPADGTPPLDDEAIVLTAGVPKDRLGQAGFNRTVAEEFFGVSASGDPITVQAVDRGGKLYPPDIRTLIFSDINQNHRFELPDPEGRPRPPGSFPILLVHRFGNGQFRYLYVLPEDRGFRAMKREIARRRGVGISRSVDTKRVYLTIGELRRYWPGCALLSVAGS